MNVIYDFCTFLLIKFILRKNSNEEKSTKAGEAHQNTILRHAVTFLHWAQQGTFLINDPEYWALSHGLRSIF